MSEVVFCTHIFFEKSGAFEQSSFGSSFSNVPEIIADWIALEINLVRSSGDEILGEGEGVTILGLLPAIGAFERASVLGVGLGFGSGAGVGLGSDLAFRHALGIDSYDKYCGLNCSLISVDIEKTARAFEKLFLSKLTTEGFSDLKTLVKYREQFKSLSDLINT